MNACVEYEVCGCQYRNDVLIRPCREHKAIEQEMTKSRKLIVKGSEKEGRQVRVA